MIKYIGSKRRLLPAIERAVDELGPLATALDPFTGTTRVARLLKQRGLYVHCNDSAWYSELLGRVCVALDARSVDAGRAAALLEDLAATPPEAGYFTETFCRRSRYLHPSNGARVDAIRRRLDEERPPEPYRSIALASLLLAADRVDSTTGVQMAYLKRWAPRALKPLQLRLPPLLAGPGRVTRLDAAAAAARAGPVDLAYLDPPYNQHSYAGNYHVWNTLVRNDRPEVYGVACKRVDCRTDKSPYNSRRLIRAALQELLACVDARHLILSFNDEGFLSAQEVESMLAARGQLRRVDIPHPRYVGARIGIHNPAGEKVGSVGRLTNREHLFIVTST